MTQSNDALCLGCDDTAGSVHVKKVGDVPVGCQFFDSANVLSVKVMLYKLQGGSFSTSKHQERPLVADKQSITRSVI